MGANDEEYLDNLLNNALEGGEQPELAERFPDQDIVAKLSRDKDREWEESGGISNEVEQMPTEDVVNSSLENLLASEGLGLPQASAEDSGMEEEEEYMPSDTEDERGDALSGDEISALFAEIAADEATTALDLDAASSTAAPMGTDGDTASMEADDDALKEMTPAEIEALLQEADARSDAEEAGLDAQVDDILNAAIQDAAEERKGREDAPDTQDTPKKKKKKFKWGRKAKAADGDAADADSGSLTQEEALLAEIREKPDGEAKPKRKRKPKKEKEKKEKKAKPQKEKLPKQDVSDRPKKKGFFQMLLNLVTEEVLDEDAEAGGVEANLSDENAAILESLPEKGAGRTGKKPEKQKGKKDKKEKKDKKGKKEKPKKDKPKKTAKPKKEKPRKEKPKPSRNQRPFPKKLIVSVALLALTVFAGLYLLTSQIPRMRTLSEARKAFYGHDYKAAYEGFYGQRLKESDQALYNQSYAILKMQRRLEAYRNYMSLGMEVEALDALMQGVAQFDELYAYAQMNNAAAEVMAAYQEILDILQGSYGLSEVQARDIVAEEDDLVYTLHLEALVGGYDYVDPYEDLDFYLRRMGVGTGSKAAADRQPGGAQASPDILPEESLLEQESRESVPQEDAPEPNGEGTQQDGALEPDGEGASEGSAPEPPEDGGSALEEEQYLTE